MSDEIERAERIADRDRCDDVEAFQRAAVEAAKSGPHMRATTAGGPAHRVPHVGHKRASLRLVRPS